jgi:hypothetical protein
LEDDMTELDPEAKQLIELARDGEGPSPLARSRLRGALLARVGAGVATTSAASGTAAAGSAAIHGTSALVIVAKIGAAAMLAGGIGAAALAHSHTPVSAEERSVAPAHVSATAHTTKPGYPDERTPTPPPIPSAVPSPSAVHAQPGAAPAAIEAETRALRSALADLRDGRADRALAALDAQIARFPQGVLAEERSEARIMALCTVDRTDEAREAAARFLAEYPRSVLAGRVRASCAGTLPRQ